MLSCLELLCCQAQIQSQFDALAAHRVPKSLRGDRRGDHAPNTAGFVELRRSKSDAGALPGQVLVILLSATNDLRCRGGKANIQVVASAFWTTGL